MRNVKSKTGTKVKSNATSGKFYVITHVPTIRSPAMSFSQAKKRRAELMKMRPAGSGVKITISKR